MIESTNKINELVASVAVCDLNTEFTECYFPLKVFYDDLTYWYPYQLYVKGFVGAAQVFSNSTTMLFSPKCMSIFIQTDKNNYQPGQTVKFRVVSVTPYGKPYKGQINIYIKVGVSRCSTRIILAEKARI